MFAEVPSLASPELIDATDIIFRMGNDNDPIGWGPAPTPVVAARPGEGRGNSDRIVITWDDDSVKNGWLQVSLRNDATEIGIPAGDVFYFGNAPGEVTTFAAGLPTPPLVNAADVIAIRDNSPGLTNPVAIDNPYDIDRDGFVNAVDLILARNNAATPLSALRMIVPAESSAPPAESEGRSPLAIRIAVSGDADDSPIAGTKPRSDGDRDDALSPYMIDTHWWNRIGRSGP